MKKLLSLLALISSFITHTSAFATNYPVTNDLSIHVIVLYWTNSAGVITTSLATNLAPGGTNLFQMPTNGIAGLGVEATNGTQFQLVNWTNMTGGSSYVGTIFSTANQMLTPSTKTVPQTMLILESYFWPDAIPTFANYQEVIETFIYYANFAYTNSLLVQKVMVANVQPAMVANLIPSTNFFDFTTGGAHNETVGMYTITMIGGTPPFNVTWWCTTNSDSGSSHVAVNLSSSSFTAGSSSTINQSIGQYVAIAVPGNGPQMFQMPGGKAVMATGSSLTNSISVNVNPQGTHGGWVLLNIGVDVVDASNQMSTASAVLKMQFF